MLRIFSSVVSNPLKSAWIRILFFVLIHLIDHFCSRMCFFTPSLAASLQMFSEKSSGILDRMTITGKQAFSKIPILVTGFLPFQNYFHIMLRQYNKDSVTKQTLWGELWDINASTFLKLICIIHLYESHLRYLSEKSSLFWFILKEHYTMIHKMNFDKLYGSLMNHEKTLFIICVIL